MSFDLLIVFASELMRGGGGKPFPLLGVTYLRGIKAQERIGVSLSLTAL
jgi:hypothetical protein